MNVNSKGPRVRKIPAGDDRERLTCPDCEFIFYENPKIVTGALASWEDKILLCRRAIEPRKNYWTLPAGFLELEESPEEGAKRESWEEARARIEIEYLIGIYTVRKISQVQMFYKARLLSPEISSGPESLEVGLFKKSEIPWKELAFLSVSHSLEHFFKYQNEAQLPVDSKVLTQRAEILT